MARPGAEEAARLYQEQYHGSPAEAYLTARGLAEGVPRYLPGFVGDSVKVGHEAYWHHLVIPYLRPAGLKYTATVRFRCIKDECVKGPDGQFLFLSGQKEDHGRHSKYQSLPGDPPRIYNTTSLAKTSPHIVIAEGEFSSWAVELDGIPSIAVQGTGAWADSFYRAVLGYARVFILGDGDEAGRKMTEKLAERLPNGVPVSLPEGEDPDSLRRQYGDGSIRRLLGMED